MTIRFPKKQVMEQDDEGQEIVPGMGDMIDVPDVKGVVEADDGDMLTVRIKYVGDHDCSEGEAKEGKEEPDGESLRAKAMEYDKE